MSLKVIFEEKFKVAQDKINELLARKEKGEDVSDAEYTNMLNEVLGKEPPYPLVLEMMQKMQRSEQNEEQVIVEFFKKNLSEDLQYITIEALKIIAIVSKNCKAGNPVDVEKQTHWVGLLENCNK